MCNCKKGRSVVQTGFLWLFTTEPQVCCRVISSEIHGGQVAVGKSFLLVCSAFLLLIFIPPLFHTHITSPRSVTFLGCAQSEGDVWDLGCHTGGYEEVCLLGCKAVV
jgi:hypothetical protein